jgi:hypothetical protein
MDELNFEPEIFTGATGGSCNCPSCRAQSEMPWDGSELESSDEDGEWESFDDGELEWDVDTTDKRPRAASCTTAMPTEVMSCRSVGSTKAKLCDPTLTVTCPPIPELWKSSTIAGVPFWAGVETAPVPGTNKVSLRKAGKKPAPQEMTPKAWSSLHTWVTLMNTFGMPLAAILTDGALYCRCMLKPRGICKHKAPAGCKGTAKDLSNHSFGDAIDIIGVVWKDPAAVGSSLKATLMHSWRDSGDQGNLLRRMNGAMRLAFNTVIDYADPGHRDHFHVDTNRGSPRKVFGMGSEQLFILGALKLLGYIPAVRPVDWSHARQGLEAFARKAGMQPPGNAGDRNAWRPITHRLYACVAFGSPANCRA